jgi:cobyrinic acid a,c-diamide synthase
MAHLLISAVHKSSGKTTITLGLAAALRAKGLSVQAFKKGPDYIDPMWLGKASGKPCYNLDFNTMSHAEIGSTFWKHAQQADISLIEGNHGLYDSFDVEGNKSNASLAALLKAPVILVLDVHGATRSIVPVILGFQQFDPSIRIAGLILSKVAGERHEQRLREVIAHYTDIPVLGAIMRDPRLVIKERHLGLIPSNESSEADEKLSVIREIIEQHVDLNQLQTIAAETSHTALHLMEEAQENTEYQPQADIRIGIARDAAFGFYYPDDLEQLRQAGAELIEFNTMKDTELPEVDGLFFGGGFPETHMEALEANRSLRQAIHQAIESGLPCYAECGGLMYLTRTISWGDKSAEMVGIIPADTVMHEKPQGRGYMQLIENGNSPWPNNEGTSLINAHEFHYSTLNNLSPNQSFAYDIVRGSGIDGSKDGLIYKNLLASYVHLRDVAGNHWTHRFVEFVRERHNSNMTPEKDMQQRYLL